STGSDIKIPIQNFAADMAVHYEALKPHIRTSPEALTPAEAKEFESRQDEFSAQFQEGPDSSQQVYESILGQLIDAGIDKNVAQKQAPLYRSVFRSLGERTGIDPVELY